MAGYIAFNVRYARIADFDGITVEDFVELGGFWEMLVNGPVAKLQSIMVV